MKAKPGKIISQIAIWLVVLLFALSCLLPLLNMVAISLSGSDAVAANKVGLWPVDVVEIHKKPSLSSVRS